MSKQKAYLLNILGVVCFGFGVFAIDYSVYRDTPDWALWYCYVSLTLIGVGILTRSARLVASQINLLFIPLLIWQADFLSQIILGHYWTGTTEYFFTDLIWPARLVALTHFWSLPVALLALYLLKEYSIKKAWVISLIQATILYFLSINLTDPKWNLNCVFQSCFPFIHIVPNVSWYPLYWFVVAFSMIGLTNLLLYWLLVKLGKNNVKS